MGTTYKSQYNAGSATYIPFFGSKPPTARSPSLSSVTVGGSR
jgi:hypothetical protein